MIASTMRDYLYDLATDKKKGLWPAIIKAVLSIFSLFYCIVVKILISFYSSCPRRLNCKVISVGNITLGGTGKTTLVEFIAGYLKEQGRKIAIISRGYKRSRAACCQLSAAPSLQTSGGASCEAMGDEPYMLSKNLQGIPVIVDADRAKAADFAVKKYGVDTVILDDGFQQWRIKKDLEIVAIDAGNPFGNRKLIPRGLLREPLSSLVRADVFVLTKVNLSSDTLGTKDFLKQRNPSALVFESEHKPQGFYDIGKPQELLNTDILKSKTVTLVSGIGDPGSFENLIKLLGINIGLNFRFPDHYYYSDDDLDKIVRGSKEKNIGTIITTEKDAGRLSRFVPLTCELRFLVLRISLSIVNDEQNFYSRLLKLYSF